VLCLLNFVCHLEFEFWNFICWKNWKKYL